MPELPEVETYRRRLEAALVGRAIRSAAIHDERLCAPWRPRTLATALRGERVEEVGRRGKYLLLRLASGRVLLVHLRMTGGFATPPVSHERARLEVDGEVLVYRDVRRLGTWTLLEAEEVEPYLARRLGPEPLSPAFAVQWLEHRLAGRRAPIKAVLLDQRVVAGLGNIYADEALWWARIHPLRPAGALREGELRSLRRGIRRALRLGIARQGADLGDGAYPGGAMQEEFRAYGRAGRPCHRCRAPIARARVAGRSAHYCPRCQR